MKMGAMAHRPGRAAGGFACGLLLIALAGCRACSSAPPCETAVAAVSGEADLDFSVASATNDAAFLLPPETTRGVPDAQGFSETAQPASPTLLEAGRPADLPARITLEDAISLALARSPELAAARAGEPVAHAAYHVAQTYPWNPQFQLQLLPYNRDRNGRLGAVAQQYSIVQTLELGGQRRYRAGAAAANWEQVDDAIGQAELMNVAQTTRLFYTAIYRRELRDLSGALAELNEQLVGVMRRRMKAGQASNADVQLAALEAQSARRRQRFAELTYQTAIASLRSHLNFDAGAPLELDGDWTNRRWRPIDEVFHGDCQCAAGDGAGDGPPSEPIADAALFPDDETALRRLVAARPDVMAARAAVAMAAENLQLAQAAKRPDLQIGPMYQRDETATEFWGLQAQMAIPVVNTGAALVRQRVAELSQQQIAAAALEDRAALEARAAIERYEEARRLVEQSRGDFARPVADALKPFENQFKAGQLSLLQVFAARAAVAQSRQSFLELLNELALAAADVTQATGAAPQNLLAEFEPLPAPLEEIPPP